MTGANSGRTEELQGVGPALKLRRLGMGLVGKQVAHDSDLDIKWFEQREAGTRALSHEPAGRWCAALGTTVGAMIDEVVGLHEVLPKALGRTLHAYVAVRGDRQTVLEISPGPVTGLDPEVIARTWENLEALTGERCQDRAVREAGRSEKEAWLGEARARIADGSADIEELIDWPLFPEDLIGERLSCIDRETPQGTSAGSED